MRVCVKVYLRNSFCRIGVLSGGTTAVGSASELGQGDVTTSSDDWVSSHSWIIAERDCKVVKVATSGIHYALSNILLTYTRSCVLVTEGNLIIIVWIDTNLCVSLLPGLFGGTLGFKSVLYRLNAWHTWRVTTVGHEALASVRLNIPLVIIDSVIVLCVVMRHIQFLLGFRVVGAACCVNFRQEVASHDLLSRFV